MEVRYVIFIPISTLFPFDLCSHLNYKLIDLFAHHALQDGLLYIWDQEKGSILQRLKGHSGAVYNGVWHPHQSLYVSCSDDRTVRSWWFDDSKPLFADDDDDDNDCGNSVAVLEM